MTDPVEPTYLDDQCALKILRLNQWDFYPEEMTLAKLRWRASQIVAEHVADRLAFELERRAREESKPKSCST